MMRQFFYGWTLFVLCVTGCSSNSQNESLQQELETEFQKSMSGVVLDGFFKTNNADSEPRKERYSITKVTKLAGEYWIFQARIQYGKRDVTLPVPVNVKWAGDTPVLTLTETTIPGLGTFSARLLFYVGVWRHGELTGQHFGRIILQNNEG